MSLKENLKIKKKKVKRRNYVVIDMSKTCKNGPMRDRRERRKKENRIIDDFIDDEE